MKGQVAALMKSKNCKREVRGAGVTKEVQVYCWAAVDGMDFLGECASSGCNAGGHVGKGVGGGGDRRGVEQGVLSKVGGSRTAQVSEATPSAG